MYLSYDIIMVLFERYLFDSNDTLATSRVLIIFAMGLPAFVCIKIFQIFFFARENTHIPMRFAFVSVIVNIILSIILFQYIGYLGIAISTTLSSWINLILLFKESIKQKFFAINTAFKKQIFKIILASLSMIFFLFIIKNHLINIEYSFISIVNFLILLFYIVISIIFYAIICNKLNIVKIRELFEK